MTTQDLSQNSDQKLPQEAGERKVFIKTYGCQMNVYDSQRMSDALTADGYVETDTIDDANLVLINTCHIREKAAEKVYSHLGRLRKIKDKRHKKGEEFIIGVTGCVAQAEGEEIMRRAPSVDLVVGPQSYHEIAKTARRALDGERCIETQFPAEDKFEYLPKANAKQTRQRGVTAFLTVQEGCDKFCSFCVVPYTRGSEVSRPVAQIIDEAKALCDAGVREITLLGQNVNGWHGAGADGKAWGLGELLYELAKIDNLARLRYTTSHPRDMDDSLINAHRDLSKLMPYLHLPIQSGSDQILKAMNRKHTGDDYRRLIDRIRNVRPDIALSGDFIVGYPGESDADFEDTMNMVRDITYAQAFSFKYSPRPGTPGALLDTQIPEDVKYERLQRLKALLGEQQNAFSHSRKGQTMEILLEKPGRKEDQIVGRSPWLQPVICHKSVGNIGDIIQVKIDETDSNSLFGELIL